MSALSSELEEIICPRCEYSFTYTRRWSAM